MHHHPSAYGPGQSPFNRNVSQFGFSGGYYGEHTYNF